jgi:thiamine pyrophosphate-dependent acetolactate synthase large subunit-like protein
LLSQQVSRQKTENMAKLTGAQALVRCLLAESVTLAFGVVGGKLAPLLYAISNEPSIKFIGLRHEAAGPMMAAAIHASSGEVAVALGEMGPGGLNLASGMGVAYGNNLPLLAITTNQHRAASYPHSGMFMDLDTRAVLAPITKWNAVVHDPRRIPELVRRAFREALSGRPGPVHLDIPQDVLSEMVEFSDDEFSVTPARYRSGVGPRPAAFLVASACTLLKQAKRPLIVAGGGVVSSGAWQQVRDLANLLNAPVIPTQMALGVVASDSPHFIGHGGLIAGEAVKQAFTQADIIIAIGCRFSSWMWDDRGPFVRRHHRLININTDPSALGHPAMHEIAMQADASLALNDILETMRAEPGISTDPTWLASVRAIRSLYDEKLSKLANENEPVMHPAALAKAIGQCLTADCLAVFDGGHTTFWSNDLTPVSHPKTRFHEPGMSHLGFGLAYAIALKIKFPSKTVMNITGDGSFGFTMNELDTARRYGLAVITLIHNNAAWGIIRSGQKMQLDFEMATSLEGTDYAAIARGFGCYGEVIENAADVPGAIERAKASGLPAVIDCRTKFMPHPAGPMFGSMNRFGFDSLTQAGSR